MAINFLNITNTRPEIQINDLDDNPRLALYESGVVSGGISTTGGALVFEASSGIERARILSTGYFGINTTTPTRTLDIRTDNGVLIKGATSTTDASLSFLPASGGREWIFGNSGSNFRLLDSSAGVTRMWFDYDGNTGIGTTVPANMLQVKSSGSDDGIGLERSSDTNVIASLIQTGSGDGALIVQSTTNTQTGLIRGSGNSYITGGNLGIGTSSPSYLLDTYKAAAGTVRFGSDDNSTIIINSNANDSATKEASILYFQDGGSTKWSLYKETSQDLYIYNPQQGKYPLHFKSAGDVVMMEDGNKLTIGSSSSGATSRLIVNQEGGVEDGFTLQARTNRARLKVADNDTAGYIVAEGSVLGFGFASSQSATNLNILGTGYVGIGITNPTVKFQVHEAGNSTTQAAITNAGTGAARLYFDASNGDLSGSDYMWIGQNNDLSGEIYMPQSAGSFYLKTQPSGSTITNFTMLQSGYIGIGTTTPAATLDLASTQVMSGSTGVAISQTTANISATSTQSSGMYATQDYMNLSGTAGSFNNVAGYQMLTSVSSTGSGTSLKNIISRVHTTGSGDINQVGHYNIQVKFDGTGNVGVWIGYGIADGAMTGFTNTQTITNTYGIYIGDITSGTQTNLPYGIYQSTDDIRNYFNSDVGIGVTSPTEKLHVQTESNTVAKFESTDGNANIRVSDNQDNAHLGTVDGKTFIGPDTSTGGNNITILSGGNVGIGTSTPDAQLEISNSTSPKLRLYRTSNTQVWEQQIDSSGRFQLKEAASSGGTQYVRFQLDDTGEIGLPAYGSGSITGTATYNLQVDSSGNIIETTAGGSFPGTVTGTGTATYLTEWSTGGTGIEDSIISSASGDVTINGSDDDPTLYINPSGGNIGDTAHVQFNSRASVGWDGYVTLSDNGQSKDLRLRVNLGNLYFQTDNTTRMTIAHTTGNATFTRNLKSLLWPLSLSVT